MTSNSLSYLAEHSEELDQETATVLLDNLSEELVEKIKNELVDEVITGVADEIQELNSCPPSKGIEKFIEKLEEDEEVGSGSVDRYETKLEYLENFYVKVLELEDLNDLTPAQIADYRSWRKYDSLDREKPLKQKTLRDDMYLLNKFCDYMVALNHISSNVKAAIDIPSEGDAVDTEKLDSARAENILSRLDTIKYASREHVVMILLIKTGRRPSGIRALDKGDIEEKDKGIIIHFTHRPETGTPLKQNESHEAELRLTGEAAQAILDYIELRRIETSDDYGREPLLTTRCGRISKGTIRKYCYKWTRPGQIDSDGPEGHDPKDCEGMKSTDAASECPASRSPKAIRKGFVTAKSNNGVPRETIGYWVGATKETLKKHYDLPDSGEERQRHEDEMLGSGGGGFAT